MNTVNEEHTIELPNGRKLVVWEACPKSNHRSTTILLVSGFCREMFHLSGLALSLVANGFRVVRYDPMDHVGLSSGSIEEFTMSGSLASMGIAADWCRKRYPESGVGIVAHSLTTRVALRFAAMNSNIQFVVFGVGVVNVWKTLLNVFDSDMRQETPRIPERVEFEGYTVLREPFHPDLLANRWLEAADTVSDLAAIKVPVVALLGDKDEWVDPDDVVSVLKERADGGARRVVRIAGAGHHMGTNRAIARAYGNTLCTVCVELDAGKPNSETIEPDFELIVSRGIEERQLRRSRELSL